MIHFVKGIGHLGYYQNNHIGVKYCLIRSVECVCDIVSF